MDCSRCDSPCAKNTMFDLEMLFCSRCTVNHLNEDPASLMSVARHVCANLWLLYHCCDCWWCLLICVANHRAVETSMGRLWWGMVGVDCWMLHQNHPFRCCLAPVLWESAISRGLLPLHYHRHSWKNDHQWVNKLNDGLTWEVVGQNITSHEKTLYLGNKWF